MVYARGVLKASNLSVNVLDCLLATLFELCNNGSKICGSALQSTRRSFKHFVARLTASGGKHRLIGFEVSLVGCKVAPETLKFFPGFLGGLS